MPRWSQREEGDEEETWWVRKDKDRSDGGQPWQIPAVYIVYKFEGMTDIINGAFMENLSTLPVNTATGDQRHRKTFYEIDTEFEKMTASLLKNFNSMSSLMPFLRVSLRQTMIRKLAMVDKDKTGWKKADEHLTTTIPPLSVRPCGTRFTNTQKGPKREVLLTIKSERGGGTREEVDSGCDRVTRAKEPAAERDAGMEGGREGGREGGME